MKIEEAIKILKTEKLDIELRISALKQSGIDVPDNNPLLEANEMAIEALEESQWIDAKEMPPKEEGEYIVMIQGADKPTALYFTPDDGWWVSIEAMRKYTVTHWKPLPKAPEV